jgi:Pyruvate/2-oxoacid:ferredoxin oxidoreductase gamma subunit
VGVFFKALNTVMLAAAVQKTGIISLEALGRTIRERLAPRLRDINQKALEITLAYLSGGDTHETL